MTNVIEQEGQSTEEQDASTEEIARLASEATKKAFDRAIELGPVVIRSGDALVRMYKDGTEEFIKELPPLIKVKNGENK